MILPPPPEERVPPVRKHLSADALYEMLRVGFEKIPDHRGRKCPISLTDALMSAFGMFSLKDPSLLAFEERRNDENMGNLFGIARVPSDTHLRESIGAGRFPQSLKRALWERLRSHFWHFLFSSMQHLYQVMLYDLAKKLPAPTLNTC